MPGAVSADNGKIDFFISRAGVDAQFAAVIGSILENAGFRIFFQQWDFANRNCMERKLRRARHGVRVNTLRIA